MIKKQPWRTHHSNSISSRCEKNLVIESRSGKKHSYGSNSGSHKLTVISWSGLTWAEKEEILDSYLNVA